jgi:hypothetical protein
LNVIFGDVMVFICKFGRGIFSRAIDRLGRHGDIFFKVLTILP